VVWINLLGKLQRIRVGEIYICWTDRQDDGLFGCDILHDKVFDDLLDVGWLVTHWNFRDTRKINKGQIQHIWSVNLEVDRLGRNSLIGPRYLVGGFLNLLSNLFKVLEVLLWEMKKYTVGLFNFLSDQLNDQGTPRHNPRSTWEKISTD
jgi:hypothetical protein